MAADRFGDVVAQREQWRAAFMEERAAREAERAAYEAEIDRLTRSLKAAEERAIEAERAAQDLIAAQADEDEDPEDFRSPLSDLGAWRRGQLVLQ